MTHRASMAAFQMLCKTRAQQSPDKLWHGIIIMGNNNGYLECLTHTASRTPLPASPDKLWHGTMPASWDKLWHGIIPAITKQALIWNNSSITKQALTWNNSSITKQALTWNNSSITKQAVIWNNSSITKQFFVMTSKSFVAKNMFVMTKYFCCDKTEPNICHDKRNFVATKVLSQQGYFCHDKHVFVTTKHIFCCKKSMPATTNVCHNKSFVVTNIILTKKSSWQAYFCCNKRRVLSWQIRVCCDKNYICGSFRQWQQDPTIAALPQRHSATSSQVSWYNEKRVFVCVHELRIISTNKTLHFIKKTYT